MRTLVYKRTHHGDPDHLGRFGVHDCMGQVRAWRFEAVIGVGGYGLEPQSYGLAGKVNWIGIGAHRILATDKRGPIVTFDHFVYYGSDGPEFASLAPNLANRIYSNNVRVIMNGLDSVEQAEVERILDRARSAPPSGFSEPMPRNEAAHARCFQGCSITRPPRGEYAAGSSGIAVDQLSRDRWRGWSCSAPPPRAT